ncbi:MAG: hypothetical protein V4550_01640 [Gemmatimonadota bacterium]
MKLLFVSEFGPAVIDPMSEDYIAALAAIRPDIDVRFFRGFFNRYIPGGTHPFRLLVAAYMYLRLPVILLRERFDFILARTSPPGLHLWCIFIGRICRIPVGVWLMDYHPELEARALDRHSLGWVAKVIRRIDAQLLLRARFAIVLDNAMEELVRAHAPRVPLIQHPTWNGIPGVIHESAPQVTGEELAAELRVAYVGNLGYSHPLETLETLLAECARHGPVRVFLVGVAAEGEARFREVGWRAGCAVEALPRTPFAELGAVFRERRIHAGVVLLDDEVAGLLSPSKYGAYLRYGIATLYVGPAGTASDTVCSHFGAGFSVRNGAAQVTLESIARSLRDAAAVNAARSRTSDAALYYRSRNGTTLAQATSPFLS